MGNNGFTFITCSFLSSELQVETFLIIEEILHTSDFSYYLTSQVRSYEP